jgi:hypothetical protein
MSSYLTTLAVVVAGTAHVSATSGVDLVTFDGAHGTSFVWTDENDPVMGGVSHSTFNISDDTGIFDGEVKIVPSLKAPGFCFLHTIGVGKFNSAKGMTHLELVVRNAGESTDYESYKVSFAADTLNPQFRSYKADFQLPANSTSWTTVHVPFTNFTNKWSPATGEPTATCAEDPSACVKDKDLEDIFQFGMWAEGKAGLFHLEMKAIRAVTPDEVSTGKDWNNTCVVKTGTQKELRWNVSMAGSQVQLPFGRLPPDETLADAICCDYEYRPYAEPPLFYMRADVDLFSKINASGETTFYDSVCGKPIFTAPRGRSFSDWQKESQAHGWPSFRDEEVVDGAVTITDDGLVFSSCGTHLGSNDPDGEGNRYCMDLSCLSGQP